MLSLAVALAMILPAPAAVLAQDLEPEAEGPQLYMPFLQDREAAVSEVEVAGSDLDQVTAAALNRARASTARNYKLTAPVHTSVNAATLAALRTGGRIQVIVRLAAPSVAESLGQTVTASAADQLAHASAVQAQQAALIADALALDSSAQVLGSVHKALNAVFLAIDSSALTALAANPTVASIELVRSYSLALSETVPYIGGTAVQEAGFTGEGITVAVLDSGVDYTHAALGGSGNVEDFENNDPNVIEAGTFPTTKIIGGYDFVGSEWDGDENENILPDPDPLDDGPEGGHGTHVADIIAGTIGVAPDASIVAVKVCSSQSPSCPNLSILQGMDFAVDPNQDGDLSDHVDIINMSLGQDYGTAADDALSFAVENATALGVLTVASAGNGADKPFIAGTPASAASALSVAQTNVPSAFLPLMQIVSPESIAGSYPATFQDWSAPLTEAIEAPAQYADGEGGNLDGCAEFAAGTLTGKIVLVDRGTCNISLKVSNVAAGGALAAIIGLIAPGDPTNFSFGGGEPTIPGYNVSLATANLIRSELDTGVVLRFDPTEGLPLVQNMVGSSSRGPSMEQFLVKPEIGAPGASVSALVGTGDGTEAFSGTSGAAPMVSGAAALLRQAFPDRSPVEIKALLMNTAESEILNVPRELGGDLAAISRIGGGEVRVDRALAAAAAAWDAAAPTAALNFTFHDLPKAGLQLAREVKVHNYGSSAIDYTINAAFRFEDDAERGAVTPEVPESISVPAGGEAIFTVKLTLDATKLAPWELNSGGNGASSPALTAAEYDGYVTLTDASDAANTIHLPWHILPRAASDITLREIGANGRIKVNNRGVADNLVEAYSLIAFSPNLPNGGPGEEQPTPDLRRVGYTTIPVAAGDCSENESFLLAFAINTWERQTHANAPVQFVVQLDTNLDGEIDYEIFTADAGFFSSNPLGDGRNLTWSYDIENEVADAYFLTDHESNSANTVLYICGEQIGMNASNFGQPMRINVLALDYILYGGPGDEINNLTIAPLGDRYGGAFTNGDFGLTVVPGQNFQWLRVVDFGSTPVNRHDRGLLLLYRGGAPAGQEAGVVIVR